MGAETRMLSLADVHINSWIGICPWSGDLAHLLKIDHNRAQHDDAELIMVGKDLLVVNQLGLESICREN